MMDNKTHIVGSYTAMIVEPCIQLIYLILSAEYISYLTMFFYKKSAKSALHYDLLLISQTNKCNMYFSPSSKALFTSKFFCKIGIVALSFVFDKYCPIMN